MGGRGAETQRRLAETGRLQQAGGPDRSYFMVKYLTRG